MKKCYNFLMVLATIVLCSGVNFASAQQDTVFLSEDFSAITGSGSQQCSTSGNAIGIDTVLPGWTGSSVYPSNGKVKLSTGSASGFIQTPAIDFTNYETIFISFQARAWNGNDATTMTVTVGDSTYQITGLPNTGASSNVECDLATFVIIANGGGEKSIRFDATNRIFIDNVLVKSFTQPFVMVQGNTTFNNISVNQEVSGELTVLGYNLTEGDTTFVTLSGDSQFATTVTTLSNDDLMGEDGANVPFTFTAAEADTYTATLSFTNSDLTEAVTVTLTANVIAMNDIATIVGLRALLDLSNVNVNITESVFYKYTGHAYVTQTSRAGSGNIIQNKWIQDETGAIQLYDPNGLISVGQDMEITNVVGWLSNYYGYAELTVKAGISNADINAFPTTIPEPVTVTLEQLRDQTFMDGIQGQLIRMENVTFDQTGTFTSYNFYTVTQNGVSDTVSYFNNNYNTLSGEEIPTGAKNMVGVNWFSSVKLTPDNNGPRLPSRSYIIPREFEAISGISENGTTPVSVYPNPTADNVILTIGGDATTVSVYNVMGKLVSTQSVSYGANTVNMSSMPAGVYFLRITNGNEAVGTVKVVRQ